MSNLTANAESWNIPSAVIKASPLTAPGMEEIEADFSTIRIVKQIPDLQFAAYENYTNKMQLLLPTLRCEGELRPLVIFIRGSAWQRQSVTAGMPQLVELARRGFIVASIEYRPATIAAFPAQVDDGWAALRFLCGHAEEMCADITRVATWGSSSGAHTALLMALMPEYRNEIKIGAVVDFYGPSSLSEIVKEREATSEHVTQLIGGSISENKNLIEKASPITYIKKGAALPSVLIMHGDKDGSCPFSQSVMLYERMVEVGADVKMYKIKNAAHGGPPFWTPATVDIVESFLRNALNWHSE